MHLQYYDVVCTIQTDVPFTDLCHSYYVSLPTTDLASCELFIFKSYVYVPPAFKCVQNDFALSDSFSSTLSFSQLIERNLFVNSRRENWIADVDDLSFPTSLTAMIFF